MSDYIIYNFTPNKKYLPFILTSLLLAIYDCFLVLCDKSILYQDFILIYEVALGGMSLLLLVYPFLFNRALRKIDKINV